MELFMPAFTAVVVVFGFIKKVPLFDAFVSGAKDGMVILFKIAPTLVGLIVAVELLKSAGVTDMICEAVTPAAEFLGFPREIVPMVLLRPISGGGSTALLTGIYADYGPDSFAGRVASVLAGSTETTFYAVAVYFGSVNITKTRHTIIAALSADFTAAVMAVLSVRILM